MMIPTFLGTPQVTLWGGPVVGYGRGGLGATNDLSVKAYQVNGVTVWASYQSPEADQVLRGIQVNANRLGAGVAVDGLIGPGTINALQRIADRFAGNTALSPQIVVGDITAGELAISIRYEASRGPQAVALHGRNVLTWVKALADAYSNTGDTSYPPPVSTNTTIPPSTTHTSPPNIPTLPSDLPVFVPTTSAGIFSKPNLPWIIGGGVLLVGLIAASIIVWK